MDFSESVVEIKLDKFRGVVGNKKRLREQGIQTGKIWHRFGHYCHCQIWGKYWKVTVCQVCQKMNWKDCSRKLNTRGGSVTKIVRKLDLAFEIRDLTKLQWALNFLRSKRDYVCGLGNLDSSEACMSSTDLRVDDSWICCESYQSYSVAYLGFHKRRGGGQIFAGY